jgi:hypothetical protein
MKENGKKSLNPTLTTNNKPKRRATPFFFMSKFTQESEEVVQ